MLFQTPKQIIGKASAWDIGAAKTLAKKLIELRLVSKKPNIHKWADEFRLLRRVYSKEEIKNTMGWYLRNAKKKYTPKAYSASTFRSKFQNIQDAMGRPQVACPKNLKVTNKILEEAKLNWPSPVLEEEVSAFAEACYTNYVNSWGEVKQQHARFTRAGDISGVRLLQYLLENKQPTKLFITQWVYALHSLAFACGSSWQGIKRGHVWHPMHPKYVTVGRGACQLYCGKPGKWDWLVSLINETQKY